MKTLTLLFSNGSAFPVGLVPVHSLEGGRQGPDFELQDQDRNTVRLSDFSGKKNVALAFYVLAFTRG